MKLVRFPRVTSFQLRELLLFGGVYSFLALINLRVKLALTPAWFDGTLDMGHYALLAFRYTNNEQSRLLQYYIPEAFRRLLNLSVPHAYIAQWWLFVFLTYLCFHFYLRKWFDSKLAFAGVLFLAAIMPLSYRNHLQQSAPLLLLTFLLALWAIRDRHVLWYVVIMAVGVLNNETMLALVAVFFFVNFRRFEWKHLTKLSAKTIATMLPAFLLVGTIRYLTRDRPHLGGAWHWGENVQGIWEALSTVTPFDYWKASYLHIFFIFGAFLLYALLKYRRKPIFLQRAALMIPLFILAHLITGIIDEVRQMLPLGFIIIPMALFFVFPLREQDRELAVGELEGFDDGLDLPTAATRKARSPEFVAVLLIGAIAALALIIGARTFATYPEAQLSSEPLHSTIELLQSQPMSEAGIICREIEVCMQVSMYLPRLDTYWLPGLDGEEAELLGAFAAQHPLLWSVERAQEGGVHFRAIERWLGTKYGKVSLDWVDGTRVARFVTTDLPEPEHTEVLFGDQILLSGYAFNAEGPYLNLVLVWENAESIDTPYKPFIHIVDGNGEMVAQNDQFPVGGFSPPNDWQPASVVRDLHGLILPAEVSGDLQARIGWYDPATGERLKIQHPPGLQGEEFLEVQLRGLWGDR